MTAESAWNDIQEKHEMAYYRGQLATEFPESYTLEEMKEIGDGMSASTAEVDAMLRADFESMPPFAQDKMLDLLRQGGCGQNPGLYRESGERSCTPRNNEPKP